MTQIDCLGIAVKSLADAEQCCEKLGLEEMPEEVEEFEKVRVAIVPVGESSIEMLEPVVPDLTIAKFLEKRGQGMHQVALRVTDLAETVERLNASGTRLINEEIKVGAGGYRYIFGHPASAGGVLLEMVEHDGPSD